jgi:hypothetical protein
MTSFMAQKGVFQTVFDIFCLPPDFFLCLSWRSSISSFFLVLFSEIPSYFCFPATSRVWSKNLLFQPLPGGEKFFNYSLEFHGLRRDIVQHQKGS